MIANEYENQHSDDDSEEIIFTDDDIKYFDELNAKRLNGEVKLSTWNEVKQRITERSKNRLNSSTDLE